MERKYKLQIKLKNVEFSDFCFCFCCVIPFAISCNHKEEIEKRISGAQEHHEMLVKTKEREREKKKDTKKKKKRCSSDVNAGLIIFPPPLQVN